MWWEHAASFQGRRSAKSYWRKAFVILTRQQFQGGCLAFQGGFGKTCVSLVNSGFSEADSQFSRRKEVAVLQLRNNARLVFFLPTTTVRILIIPPLEYSASEDRTRATGKYFPNSPWQNGDFLGIASVSFRRRTPLRLGHCSTATDGTSITVNHTTWVDLAKSVVAVIGAWLLFSTQQRKRRPNSCFLIKSLRHKSPFIKQLRSKTLLWHRILGNLASSRQLNGLLKGGKTLKCVCFTKYVSFMSSRLRTIFLCVSCFGCHIFHIWLFCRKRDLKEKIFPLIHSICYSHCQRLLLSFSHLFSCFEAEKKRVSFLRLLFFISFVFCQ